MDFKKSQRDWQQTLVYSHDEDSNSTRVSIVAGSDLLNGLSEGITKALSDVKIEVPQNSQGVQVIEIPKIITETKIEQVPVIVKEIEYREIQVPIVIKEFEVKEVEKIVIVPQVEFIEKPIIIEKIVEKDSNNRFLNKILIVQTIGLILLSLILLLKK